MPMTPHDRRTGSAPRVRGPLAVLGLIVLALGLTVTVFPTAVSAQNPYGEWKPAFDVDVPGTPVAELELAGETYLLLEGIHPDSAVEAFLWNPTTSIPFPAGQNDIFVAVDAVVGMQSTVGPRVFACGLFFLDGIETRLAMWDGIAWGVPGTGPVTGPAIQSLAVRERGIGPELWIGGGLLQVPGLPSPRTIAAFDGDAWRFPGPFSGLVDSILMVENSTSGIVEAIVTGENLVTAGGIGGNLLRYDGVDWDDMNGGVLGADLVVSALEIVPGSPEIWVTGVITSAGSVTNLASIARFRNGDWESFSAGGGFLLGSPGKLMLLPTAYGDMVFAELPIFSFPTTGNFVPGAWDPTGVDWIEVPVSAEGAYRFESPSGLFPSDVFFRSTSPVRLRWEAAVGEFRRGDANGDGSINLGDAIASLNHTFLGMSLSCAAAADVNADDSIDIADPIALLSHLFPNGSPQVPIPAPWPACGLPPTFGSLRCVANGCP